MDDGTLEEWARRRDAGVGRLRAVPVTSGAGPKGAHVSPSAPRVIERWNGYAWEPYGLAADLTAAKAVLFPERGVPEVRGTPPPGPGLGPGNGRHRKPPAPGARGR